jgi:4-amino-4-deoxy-L-arabinose transferase-like glycosyltransferase
VGCDAVGLSKTITLTQMATGHPVARIVAILCAAVIVCRLAGLELGALLPTPLVVLLLAAAHVVEPIRRHWDARRLRDFVRAHPFEIGVTLLMLLSFAVRLPGLNRELGHTLLDFDESRLAASVRTFFAKGELQHTTVEHHPGLAFWLFAASSFVSILNRMAHGGIAPAALLPLEVFVAAARVANLFVAAATVGLTAVVGRRLAGDGAGLMAGLIVAIVPLSVDTTTQCRCDPVMVLCAVVALDLALRCLKEPRLAWFATAGAVAGAAAAIKYSGVFTLVPVLLAALVLPSWRQRFRTMMLTTAWFVAAVAITNHFIWSDFPNFLRQLSDQIGITGPGHWAATGDPRGFYAMILSRYGTGAALLVLAGAFTIYALATRRLEYWVVISFPTLYLAFMTGRPSQFPRWVYPMVPFVSVIAAAALRMILDRARAWLAARSVTPRAAHALAIVVAASVLAQPAWSGTVALSRRLTVPPYARTEARIRELARPGEVVVLEKGWLDLSTSGLTIRRVDDLRKTFDGGLDQFSGANWVIVPKTQFGHPLLKQLGFYERIHADQGFGGSVGYDFEIYAVPKR